MMTEIPAIALTAVQETQAIEAARRDPRHFSPLYRAYVRPVYCYIYSRIGNTTEAEDLTSQVFIEALESLARYHHRGYFLAWLLAIARHRMLNYQQRRQPQVSLENIEGQARSEEDPLATLIHHEQVRRLSYLIAALRKDEQDLLRLRFVAELSYREIGVLLERREDAVKKQIYRLLVRLESQLEAGHD